MGRIYELNFNVPAMAVDAECIVTARPQRRVRVLAIRAVSLASTPAHTDHAQYKQRLTLPQEAANVLVSDFRIGLHSQFIGAPFPLPSVVAAFVRGEIETDIAHEHQQILFKLKCINAPTEAFTLILDCEPAELREEKDAALLSALENLPLDLVGAQPPPDARRAIEWTDHEASTKAEPMRVGWVPIVGDEFPLVYSTSGVALHVMPNEANTGWLHDFEVDGLIEPDGIAPDEATARAHAHRAALHWARCLVATLEACKP